MLKNILKELLILKKAVKKLKNIGVTVITHMIIGLPFENEKMIVETADFIGRSGADGIKLQLLHVLKGTDLEKDYLAGKFEVLSLEKYTEILKKCLAVLPPDMVVHRMTGDGDKKKLIAPLWSADKKKVLNYCRIFWIWRKSTRTDSFLSVTWTPEL